MIRPNSRIVVRTEDSTRFEYYNAIATVDVNRAIEIDTFERIFETNFKRRACVDRDCSSAVGRDDSDVGQADAFVARRTRWVGPFPDICTSWCTQQVIVHDVCYRARKGDRTVRY